MTQKQFEVAINTTLKRTMNKVVRDEILRMQRRLDRLVAVARGDARIVKVYRSGYTVAEHKVSAHYMHLVRAK